MKNGFGNSIIKFIGNKSSAHEFSPPKVYWKVSFPPNATD
jgi:hypothetical protein